MPLVVQDPNSDSQSVDSATMSMHSRSQFINYNHSQNPEIGHYANSAEGGQNIPTETAAVLTDYMGAGIGPIGNNRSVAPPSLNGNTEAPSPFTFVAGQQHEKVSSAEYLQASHYDELADIVDVSTPKPWQYLCDICGRFYTTSSYFWQHLRFHREIKPVACTLQDRSRKFTTFPVLNDHIRKNHTGDSPQHCLICGKRFLTGSILYQHCLIHRKKPRYGCEVCGKSFYRADRLKNHLKIHTGEKPLSSLNRSKHLRPRVGRDKHIRTPARQFRRLKLYLRVQSLMIMCLLATSLF